jgi:Cytochrome C and Quinol oxidase polypeptide I/LAGLIDADG endonuclease
MIGAPDM